MKFRWPILLGALVCFGMAGLCQPQVPDEDAHALIREKAESVFASLVELRRDIHRHPEPSGQEKRTSALVGEYLSKLGLEVRTGVGGFGVVGILKGASPGRVVAWRADMDAFADDSPDNAPFRSVVSGLKHCCGHDVHTTIGLGMAHVLSSLKDRLSGTVLFVFQPSEENFRGARAVLADDPFGPLKPEAVLALHVGPLPAGVVAVKPNEMFACRVEVAIRLKNISDEKEALDVCAGLLKELNAPPGLDVLSIPLSDVDKGPFSPQSPLAGFFTVGDSPAPVMTEEGDAGHAVRINALSSSRADIESAVGKLKEALSRSKLRDNVISVECSFLQPPVFNDPGLTVKSMEIIQTLYGKNSLAPLYGVIPGFNDDFAFFQQQIPGVYFFLGGSDFGKGVVSMPHAPNFEVDESCIKAGTALFSSLLFELTKK